MKRIFTLAMLMLAFDAHAQQVHKCVDHRGNVAYQSQPCAAAQTTARTWEAQPDPVSDRPAVPVAEPRRSTQNAYPKSKGRSEPPRVLRRLQLLRRWSYEQVEQVFP